MALDFRTTATPLPPTLLPPSLRALTLHAFTLRWLTLFAFTLGPSCFAQETSVHAIGLFSSYNLNSHETDFRSLPGVPNCCPRFERGTGTGVTIGAFYERELTSSLSLALRLSHMTQDGTLTATQFMPVDIDGMRQQARIEHSIDARLAKAGTEALVGYRLPAGILLHAGIRFDALLSGTYQQAERLVEPPSGTFENGRRLRNEFSGDLPGTQSFSTSLVGGISYELPLNESATVFMAPEIMYVHGLSSILADHAWNAYTLRLGIALRYRAGGTPAPVVPPSPPISPPTTDSASLTAMPVCSISARTIVEGEESTVDTVIVQEVLTTDRCPLLPYVFFDKGSNIIPARYQLRSPGETGSFDAEKMIASDALEVYHHLLDIVGARLGAGDAVLTVTGCNDDHGVEEGNLELSRQRAVAVRDYLASVWGIDGTRIHIEVRNLPRAPSNALDEDGRAENRRVELSSSDHGLFRSVMIRSTESTVTPREIAFIPAVAAEPPVRSWTLALARGEQPLEEFQGMGTPPERITWHTGNGIDGPDQAAGPVVYRFGYIDSNGRASNVAEGVMTVVTKQLRTGAEQEGEYQEIKRYSLILFDFNETALDERNREIVRSLRDGLAPGSIVRVTGYTDRIGSAEYNRQLSTERARQTVELLGVQHAVIEGIGEDVELHDNTLPEGRLYSRTVHIRMETPRRQ